MINKLTLSYELILAIGVIVLVIAVYQGVVYPNAEQAKEVLGVAAVENLWVRIADWPQQISIGLAIYAAGLIFRKVRRIVYNEKQYAEFDFTKLAGKELSLSETKEELIKAQALSHLDNYTVDTWLRAIRRFESSEKASGALDTVNASIDSLEKRLESENTWTRYIIWAIPSFGFVGTVLGIALALSQAEEAIGGDISGMVGNLGLAFNSTLVSLILSIALMFYMHYLNRQEDKLVIDTQKSCDKYLMRLLDTEEKQRNDNEKTSGI